MYLYVLQRERGREASEREGKERRESSEKGERESGKRRASVYIDRWIDRERGEEGREVSESVKRGKRQGREGERREILTISMNNDYLKLYIANTYHMFFQCNFPSPISNIYMLHLTVE